MRQRQERMTRHYGPPPDRDETDVRMHSCALAPCVLPSRDDRDGVWDVLSPRVFLVRRGLVDVWLSAQRARNGG